MKLNRRNLLKSIMAAIPALMASGYGWQSFRRTLKGEQAPARTVDSLMKKYPVDRIDENIEYIRGHNFSQWHREIHRFFKRDLIGLSVPPTGPVVELGVYKGQSAALLKKMFGPFRYVGVDAVAYKNIKGVIQADVRTMADLPVKAAFIWNDISTWEGSPRSRLAAFEWSKRNLAKGAIYVDEGPMQIPVDLDYSGFELITKSDKFTVFRKV